MRYLNPAVHLVWFLRFCDKKVCKDTMITVSTVVSPYALESSIGYLVGQAMARKLRLKFLKKPQRRLGKRRHILTASDGPQAATQIPQKTTSPIWQTTTRSYRNLYQKRFRKGRPLVIALDDTPRRSSLRQRGL